MRWLCVLLAAIALGACDAGPDDAGRTTETQRLRLAGYELRGVQEQRDADGELRYLLSDDLREVVRFTARPRATLETPCSGAAEVCQTLVVGRPRGVQVTLSQPVVSDGDPLPAGTDLAFALSEPDRQALLTLPPQIPDTPQADRFVALDPTRVEVPAGALTVRVVWTTADPDQSYVATRQVTFTP